MLLLWLGKDSVGGGHIRVARTAKLEEIEVLFGSDPTRVPGGINRWGYGRESAEIGSGITRTSFVGFMRYSPEQSMEQTRRNTSA